MGRLLAIVIWGITIASVWMFVSGKWWFPASISEHGGRVDTQFMITIIVVGISFTAAQVGLGWVIWKFRDAGPLDRLVFGKALPDRLQHRRVQPDLGMAGHAGLRRRQSRLRGRFHAGVAVSAINSEFAGMMPMAEGDRLRRPKICRGDIAGPRKANDSNHAACHDGEASQQEQPQPGIGGRREYLGHPGSTRL